MLHSVDHGSVLLCSWQTFENIEQVRIALWANKIWRDLSLKRVSRGQSILQPQLLILGVCCEFKILGFHCSSVKYQIVLYWTGFNRTEWIMVTKYPKLTQFKIRSKIVSDNREKDKGINIQRKLFYSDK